MLHRDLKPANIMIDGRGQARITDFGIASRDVTGEIRRLGRKAGTPAYMAPEQMIEGENSVQSDLYALGLVLYEMATGQPAFRADTQQRSRSCAAIPRRHHPPTRSITWIPNSRRSSCIAWRKIPPTGRSRRGPWPRHCPAATPSTARSKPAKPRHPRSSPRPAPATSSPPTAPMP